MQVLPSRDVVKWLVGHITSQEEGYGYLKMEKGTSLPPLAVTEDIAQFALPVVLYCVIRHRATDCATYSLLIQSLRQSPLVLFAGERVGLVVNNLGGTSNLEMGVLTNDAVRHLGATLSCRGTWCATELLELFVLLQLTTAVWVWCVWSLAHSQRLWKWLVYPSLLSS